MLGADGATSQVAASAGLVDPNMVLWGFAIRTYLPQVVDLPAIVLWDQNPLQAFPGYGWVFPEEQGGANVGLGVGTRSDRKSGTNAVRALPEFLEHLHALGLLNGVATAASRRRLGGWLNMGIVKTIPARGPVLLVGDAAGLVNPMQGEGIAQAITSGRAAVEAILGGPGFASDRYGSWIAAEHLPYHRIAAAVHAGLVGRPRATAAVARLLTVAGRGDVFSGGWAVFWNELLDGAPLNRYRSVANAVTHIGRVMTARSATAKWFCATLR